MAVTVETLKEHTINESYKSPVLMLRRYEEDGKTTYTVNTFFPETSHESEGEDFADIAEADAHFGDLVHENKLADWI